MSTEPRTPQRFQLLSDLHLEFPLPSHKHQYDSYTIAACAPYLVLAGDIGLLCQFSEFLRFLQRVSRDFEHVFLVLGNHEFYRTSRAAGLDAALRLEAQCAGKVSVMNRRRVDVGDVAVLGCTLHSALSRSAAERERILMGLNDFHLVGGWGLKEYEDEHRKDLEWLRAEVEAVEEGRKVLVVTHHAPMRRGTSNPVFDGGVLGSAFASGILESGGWEKVHTWAFGHTHWCCDFVEEVGGVRVVANQGGYAREGREGKGEGGGGFVKEFVVEV
ncbi:Metallo-dependent phosphatase-like protein [Sphaerosporella brunnea]|uniref:Metallo-dependent phosphatase-like protein n=1 Tax=Sphaerosporella brunnea TaxID=1250544 RepID=A0A5J5F0T7_9PEZI|nr:Metallo-dependent phosphatase-like protein [Sphaerosporella brunnea]